MTGRGLPVSVELSGALEIGGSHVSSALVDRRTGQMVPGSRRRRDIKPGASADELVNGFSSAMTEVGVAPDAPLGDSDSRPVRLPLRYRNVQGGR